MGTGRPRLTPEFITKGDPYTHYNYNAARAYIGKHAREVYRQSGRPRVCFFCGYSFYVEVAHRKAVKDFSMETLISEINHIDNLVMLCPNHHREADSGQIDLIAAKELKTEFGEVGFVPSTHTRKRKPYGQGSVVLRERKKGFDMWVFLYRSGGKHKSLNIGTIEKYPTKEATVEAVKSIRQSLTREFSTLGAL